MITIYELGDKVTITPETFRIIHNGNRSITAYPSDSYLDIARNRIGVTGVVTQKFTPSYEVNVTFEDAEKTVLQVKDHWIEKL